MFFQICTHSELSIVIQCSCCWVPQLRWKPIGVTKSQNRWFVALMVAKKYLQSLLFFSGLNENGFFFFFRHCQRSWNRSNWWSISCKQSHSIWWRKMRLLFFFLFSIEKSLANHWRCCNCCMRSRTIYKVSLLYLIPISTLLTISISFLSNNLKKKTRRCSCRRCDYINETIG